MDRHLPMMRLAQQLSVFVLSAFRVLALALAAVALDSVVSYGVAQRTHKIGIRMALGTHGRRVVRQLVGDGLKLVVAGGGAHRRRDAPTGRPAVRDRRARPADVPRYAARARRRGTARSLRAGPPRQSGQSRRRAPRSPGTDVSATG